jgi:endonuclease/exonuclease/phosphatase family metal-dependent hydrolase
LTLLLFPILYLDLRIFARPLLNNPPAPRKLVPGMLLGSLLLVLLVFMQIFTNVWGYVKPVSPWFRGKFWLPYLLMTAGITVLAARISLSVKSETPAVRNRLNSLALAALVLLFLVTAGASWLTTRTRDYAEPDGTLRVMTYNIQQANDEDGQRSYRRQLALIRQVDPDILALQESDSARVSLNNNDYVRYFAGRLGYHAYYGPKTVAGTYGTAILSKFPLQDPHTLFSYSDQDEIGTAAAQITLDGHTFTIYDVHPDGSDTAMMVFSRTILAETEGKNSVIVLGDFNLRPDEQAYQVIDAVLTNAWESAYPDGVGADGTGMSTRKRIDHIFVSPDLGVENPVYLLPPDSATDHPAHWADITW